MNYSQLRLGGIVTISSYKRSNACRNGSQLLRIVILSSNHKSIALIKRVPTTTEN